MPAKNNRGLLDKIEDDFMYDFYFQGDQGVKDYLEYKRKEYNQRTQKATLGFLVVDMMKNDKEYQNTRE